MIKSGILIVKYYKKGELYSSQVLNPYENAIQKQAVGQKTQTTGYWGLNLSYENKSGWMMTVNGRKRDLVDGSEVTLNDKVKAIVEVKSTPAIKLGNVEANQVKKIQVMVLDSKNQYVFSDILPNKRSQKFSFADTKIKINRPVSDSWDQIHKDDKGYKISVRQVSVPAESEIKPPIAFTSEDKELIRKIAYGYIGAIAFFLITYGLIYLIQNYFKQETKFDVVKIDEKLLEVKREKLLKERKVVTPETKTVAKVKTVKAYEKSKVIEKGAAKKAIAKKIEQEKQWWRPKN